VKVYPARRTCRGCGATLAHVGMVYAGMYCSYYCAGVEAPNFDDVMSLPRGCRRRVGDDRWLPKRRWPSKAIARSAARHGEDAYYCDHCLTWHVGTSWRKQRVADVGDASNVMGETA